MVPVGILHGYLRLANPAMTAKHLCHGRLAARSRLAEMLVQRFKFYLTRREMRIPWRQCSPDGRTRKTFRD